MFEYRTKYNTLLPRLDSRLQQKDNKSIIRMIFTLTISEM